MQIKQCFKSEILIVQYPSIWIIVKSFKLYFELIAVDAYFSITMHIFITMFSQISILFFYEVYTSE